MGSSCRPCSNPVQGAEVRSPCQQTGKGCGCSCDCASCASSGTTQAAQPRPERDGARRRLKAPRSELRALVRKVQQLERLASQCTFYERHEVVDPQGQVLSRSSRGVPLVHRRGLGMVPVDPDDPFLDDGTAVSVSILGYLDEDRNYHRIVRYRRLPAGQGAGWVEVRGQVPRREDKANRQDLLRGGKDPVPVFIYLRDREALPRVPSRARSGLLWKTLHRQDPIKPLRRRLLRERRAKRQVWAGPLVAWLRSVGGAVGYHATSYCNMLSARVPRRHLDALLDREDVVRVEPRPTDPQPEEAVDHSYLCTNLPVRYNATKEEADCFGDRIASPAGPIWSGDHAYLDAHHAATGALDYINAGYDGMIEGNADWATMTISTVSSTERPTLSIGFRDWWAVDVHHAAFRWGSRSRFRYVMDNCLPDSTGDGEPECADFPYYFRQDEVNTYELSNNGIHGTRCAAIAMANLFNAADPDLTALESRGARSGVARRMVALAAVNSVNSVEMLDAIYDGGLDTDGVEYDGLDVYSSSAGENNGEHYYYYRHATDSTKDKRVRCPDEADARGLDTNSQALVWYFYNEGVVFLKAAGNNHHHTIDGVVYHKVSGCAVVRELTAPGASPAAIASGALYSEGMTAAELQDSTSLRDYSSGGTTLDGRTYPSLVVTGEVCGCASTEDAATPGATYTYAKQGGTSSTAPRMAGSAVLFKHWLIEQYGWVGNFAGYIVAGLLNFADGYATRTPSTIARDDPPASWWGLGRFRMRLFSDAQQTSARALHGFTAVALSTRTTATIDLTDGGRHLLPRNVRHLRITAWWLDVNTDEGESKAAFLMRVVSDDSSTGSGTTSTVDAVSTGTDTVLRLQYDRDDLQFPCPPRGRVQIEIHGLTVPTDRRSVSEVCAGRDCYELRRTFRTVYVAWFWECAEDSTEIVCSESMATPGDRCDESILVEGDDPDVHALTSRDTADLRASRVALDTSIRETLRLATRLAPSSGTSLVGLEGRC